MKLKSNNEWRYWGETDPKWAVAAWDGKQSGSENAWKDDEFYALGAADWQDFEKQWSRYGFNRHSCVEVGSGAGRITKQLAKCFEEVHGLDVSEHMLEYARQQVDASNVHLHLTDGEEMPLADASVTAAFSCHVLQHLDNLQVAAGQFSELARILKPGGTLMVHIPVHAWPYESKAHQRLHSFRSFLSDVKADARRFLAKLGIGSPGMRGLSYPVSFFYQELPRMGFIDIEMITFCLKSNNSRHTCVLATKRSD